MADELIDIYDENNTSLNIQKMKSEAHKKGLWHRVSHIWIYNNNGEVLLQLRAKTKDLYPNMWDISVAGHIGAGEEPIIAALREIKEEIGLDINKENLEFLELKKDKHIYKKIINNEHVYVYLLKLDEKYYQENTGFELQKEEVELVEFFNINIVKEEIKTKLTKYVPHEDYWNKALDAIHDRTR